jgi:hypothetical protein
MLGQKVAERQSKTRAEEAFNLMQRTEKANSQYRLYEEPVWIRRARPIPKIDSTGNAKGGRFVESLIYPVIKSIYGRGGFPKKRRCWVYKKDRHVANGGGTSILLGRETARPERRCVSYL